MAIPSNTQGTVSDLTVNQICDGVVIVVITPSTTSLCMRDACRFVSFELRIHVNEINGRTFSDKSDKATKHESLFWQD